MLALKNAKLFLYAAIALIALGGLIWGYNAIGDRREDALTIQGVLRAQHTESTINESTNEASKAKAKNVSVVRQHHSSIVSSLRERPSRPPNYSSASPIGSPSTGRELYREDAEFLAGEAARAERIRIERDFYYERYEEARRQLASP